MRTRLAALAALVVLPLAACSVPAVRQAAPVPAAPAAPLVATSERPACTGDVVTVHGDAPTPCDVTPPQRLDVTGVDQAECDHMGGRMNGSTCEGVDY